MVWGNDVRLMRVKRGVWRAARDTGRLQRMKYGYHRQMYKGDMTKTLYAIAHLLVLCKIFRKEQVLKKVIGIESR